MSLCRVTNCRKLTIFRLFCDEISYIIRMNDLPAADPLFADPKRLLLDLAQNIGA